MLSDLTRTVNERRPAPDTAEITDLYRLALRKAELFRKPVHHDAAAYQEVAILAALRAPQTWDPARGATLLGYAAFLIERALYREYARQKLPAGISVCSLDVPIGDGDARLEELLADETAPNPEAELVGCAVAADLHAAVQAALTGLSERQRQLLTLMFWHELPVNVAARELRMSLPIARRLLALAFEHLQRALCHSGAELAY